MQVKILWGALNLLLCTLLVTACVPIVETPTAPPSGAGSGMEKPSPVPDAATPTVIPEEEPMPQSDLTAYPPVQQAVADLATRLNVDESDITLVRIVEVDWPDGSLGCPQPDMLYKQMLVNGSFIQLEAGGQTYNYHNAGMDAPFLCTSKEEVLPEDLPGHTGGDPDI